MRRQSGGGTSSTTGGCVDRQRTRAAAHALLVSSCLALGAACLPPVPDLPTLFDAGPPPECVSDDDCVAAGLGLACVDATCAPGRCDPALNTQCLVDGLDSGFCCAPTERCNAGFTCELDPALVGVIGCAPADGDCVVCDGDDGCAGGQFCSGAACVDVAGREDCVSSFDCPIGQRCDRTEFLCVEDRGGCALCGDAFPELCCEDGQLCGDDGFCVDIGDPECAVNADCGDGEPLCSPVTQQCVQCIVDDDCGPNLLCDSGQGTCFSELLFCAVDDDCSGNQRCASTISQCVLPQCEDDFTCTSNPEFDARYRCDLGMYRCFLPPPVCAGDVDEPNDDFASASLIEGFAASGQLCRESNDVWRFPVIAERRYDVTVSAAAAAPGVIVTLFDVAEVVESTVTFTGAQTAAGVAGVTAAGEAGFFFVGIVGNNTSFDLLDYTITIVETNAGRP